MKKLFSSLLAGILCTTLMAGCNLIKSDAKLLEKAFKNTNEINKCKSKYNFSIKDNTNKNSVKMDFDITSDLKEDKSLMDFSIALKDFSEKFTVYSNKNNSFIKLSGYDKFISYPKNASSKDVKLANLNTDLVNKSFKNFEAYIRKKGISNDVKLETEGDFKVLKLSLSQEDLKILYDKFIEINMGSVKDLFIENVIDEMESLNNKKFSKSEKDKISEELHKNFEKTFNEITSKVTIKNMNVNLYIDKKDKIIKKYKTHTNFSMDKNDFIINLDSDILEHGDKVQFKNIDTKNSISYEDYIKSIESK
ncbi:hypothetical protein HAHI6034_10055 [Hathewaya histolytica]|uniref:Lipoprotein n=1 Tax=Hathewaya histolytica TaxID=1498 RepID=A0A4V6Z140_HATHI|nr:hypothetical protein [Hathewaya histolytica]VTQ83327.1 Uncharacterised protein [Hathewaya histolytica]